MRILIAAACIAILAATGVYLWGQWKEHRATVELEERRKGAEDELFELAKAKPYETSKVRDWCKRLNERLDGDLKNNELAPGLVRNCRILGYL